MNPKYQKVLSDIDKAEKKKSEIEGQLKELYDKKTELENLAIINTCLLYTSHRAYLHVREDIDEKFKEARQIMTKVSVDMIGFYFKVDVPKCSNSDENTPFADAADCLLYTSSCV